MTMKQVLSTFVGIIGLTIIIVKIGNWVFDVNLWWLYIIAAFVATAMSFQALSHRK